MNLLRFFKNLIIFLKKFYCFYPKVFVTLNIIIELVLFSHYWIKSFGVEKNTFDKVTIIIFHRKQTSY